MNRSDFRILPIECSRVEFCNLINPLGIDPYYARLLTRGTWAATGYSSRSVCLSVRL